VSLYLAFIAQHPGVFVRNAFAAASDPYALKAPPGACTAYSAVNPKELRLLIAVMIPGAALHVFAIAANTGTDGNMTAFTPMLVPHNPVPGVPAAVVPHATVNT